MKCLSICPTTVLKPFSFCSTNLVHRCSSTILAAFHRHSHLQTWQTFQPPSYGPISLTSNACQKRKKMVVNRLKWYLEFYSLLNDVQSGFRHRRKTTDHIMRLHDIVTKSLAINITFWQCSLTLRKKTIRFLKMLYHSTKIGINENMFSFTHSFLSDRSFQVWVGSSLSQIKYPANGIPQGSILSPVWFSILINDLPGGIRSRTALYADDFSCWESGSRIRQLNDLCQQSLTKVENGVISGAFKFHNQNQQQFSSLINETSHLSA